MARELRMPPAWLLESIIYRPDPSVDPVESRTIRLGNKYERLYLAAWMLHDGTSADYRRALDEAFALYDGCGSGLLEKPGQLTTADVVAEVLQLLEARA